MQAYIQIESLFLQIALLVNLDHELYFNFLRILFANYWRKIKLLNRKLFFKDDQIIM